MTRISIEQENNIIDLYNKGFNFKKIGLELHTCKNTIKKILDKHNIFYKNKPVFSNFEKDRVLELHTQGKTLNEISDDLKRPAGNISKIIRKNGLVCNKELKRKRKYPVDHHFFSILDTQEKVYFLGFLFADGSVSKSCPAVNMQLAIKDKAILEKFTKLVQPTKPIFTFKNNLYVGMTMDSHTIKNDLCNFGCIPNKTYVLTYPKNIPAELENHFIRGIIDGDGCIFVKDISKVCIVITGCDDFLNGIEQTIFKAVNAKGKLYNNSSHHPKIKDLRYYGRLRCQTVLDWVYRDSKIHLDRKFNNYKILKESFK